MTTTEAPPETAPESAPEAPERKGEATREAAFFERLRALYRDPRGSEKAKLARLRRAAGDALGANVWVYGLLPRDLTPADESLYYLTATLAAFDRKYLEGRSPRPGTLGATLARLKASGRVSPEALDRRFRVLLDARLDPEDATRGEMPFRLRQMVKLSLAHEADIDWPQLLRDLRFWNFADDPRRVAKRWARDYYGVVDTSGGEPGDHDDTEEASS